MNLQVKIMFRNTQFQCSGIRSSRQLLIMRVQRLFACLTQSLMIWQSMRIWTYTLLTYKLKLKKLTNGSTKV
uniref:Glutathione transferase n=1 Tax=Rhizophora mucronata TaxID=61149 RepID=A0A2P2JYT4_RHIMU